MKRILVPTDFSKQADYAFELACQIAEKTGADLIGLHVLDYTGLFDYSAGSGAYPILGSPAGIEYDERLLDTLYNTAKDKFQTYIEKYKDRNVAITPKVKLGNTYHYITEEVEQEKTDLLIMGSQGASALEEALIGSTTEKVVRNSKCPVLTVKSKTNLRDIRDIAFASNFTEDESHVAEDLKKLQEVFEACLHLVYINTPNEFTTTREIHTRIQNFIQINTLPNCTTNVYNDKVEEDGIIYFAEDMDADMIALATHGRSGLMHLLSGSIAEDVVNHANRPVWTFRLKHK
jgi:nucleotide-binding universal stress UspA family protein